MRPLVTAFAAVMIYIATPETGTAQNTVLVEPASATLTINETVQLRATVLNSAGHSVEPQPVLRWFTRDPETATVDQSGLVTALNPGSVRIGVGTTEDALAAVTVTVRELPPAEIAISIDGGSVRAGASAQLETIVYDRLGGVLNEFPLLSFEVSRNDIASVDDSGRLYAHRTGRVVVRASSGDATGELQIEVTGNPAESYRIAQTATEVRTGDVLHLTVEGVTSDGEVVSDYRPAWSVGGAGAFVRAEEGEGVFVAERPGRYTVVAVIGSGEVATTGVSVTQREIPGELVLVGRGPAADHHSGDMWVFPGVDGRDYAYIGTYQYDWMKVWDVTDPATPVLTDSVRVDARRINDVKIHPNNRIGVITREGASSRRNGIVLLDLSTPAHPTILSEYTATVTGGVHNVWIDGDHELVYAVHNGTSDVHIIDISDPLNPNEVGRWGLDNPDRSLHDVIVQDGYAYVSYWQDGLVMLDVGAGSHGGTPTEPRFVSRFEYPVASNTHTAFRYGRYLFVGDEVFPPGWDADVPIDARGYVHVIDYSDVENPVEVAKYEVPEAGAHNFWIEDDLMYIGYYQGGLRVVDVSGELRGDLYEQGREIAVLRTTDANTTVPNWPMTFGAQIFKGNVYTSDFNSGLWIAKYRRPELTP